MDSLGGSIFQGLSRAKTVFQKQPAAKQSTPMPKLDVNGGNPGDFFIRMAFDLFANSKDYRKLEALSKSVALATTELDSATPTGNSSIVIFQPFQIACRSNNPELLVIAIDCLGKLFSYNYWKPSFDSLHPENIAIKRSSNPDEEDQDAGGTVTMIAFVIDTICDGFSGESTDEKVQLQIIKAFQAALSNTDPSSRLHGAVLLKAIRTTYNIFLLSKVVNVQIVAQATVTQMVQNVMGRIPKTAGTSDTQSKLNREAVVKSSIDTSLLHREIQDSFKVFRTLCILSMKPLPGSEG